MDIISMLLIEHRMLRELIDTMVFDIIFHAPGQYPFVDHSMRDMNTDAVGVIDVTP